MDTTERYIKMCEKAEEIQTLIDMFQLGNFLWRGKAYLYEGCVCDKVPYFKVEEVWLPRQDELQDMIIKVVDYETTAVLENRFHKFLVWLDEWDFTSMEQLWLAFVMREKYNKVWNEEEWIEEVKVPFIGGICVRHGDIK